MPNSFEFLIYNTADGDVSVNAVVRDETIQLTQKDTAQLFDCSTDNIYQSGKLAEEATAEDFSVVQKEGRRNVIRRTKFYNLDAIKKSAKD